MAKDDVGAIWVKPGKKGEYLSISIDIGEGVRKQFVAFRNDYKKEGDKAPDYRIFPKIDRSKEYDDENYR